MVVNEFKILFLATTKKISAYLAWVQHRANSMKTKREEEYRGTPLLYTKRQSSFVHNCFVILYRVFIANIRGRGQGPFINYVENSGGGELTMSMDMNLSRRGSRSKTSKSCLRSLWMVPDPSRKTSPRRPPCKFFLDDVYWFSKKCVTIVFFREVIV